jgi:porin
MKSVVTLLPALAAMALSLHACGAIASGTGVVHDNGGNAAGLPILRNVEEAPASLENGIKALGGEGVQFKFDYSGEAFANLSGGVRRGGDYEGLVSISVDLDLQKLFHWDGATLCASMLYPHGNGITDQYVHDYNVVSNIDAYDSIRLFQLWFQQAFFDDRFSIRAGQLATDNDLLVSNNSALFINNAFGAIGTIVHDVNQPTYPVGSEGIRLRCDVTPLFYLESMAVDDNPGAQNLGDKHGTEFGPDRSHGVLAFFEMGYIPNPSLGTSPLGAAYKFGGYFDSQFHPDISKGSSGHGDYGFYAVADQPLYVPTGVANGSPEGLSGFARVSYAPDQRNAVVYYFDAGVNYTGMLPGRPTDIFGAAFSFERLGADVDQAFGAPVLSHHEHVIEITYLANLTDWLALQPDFQYIINPGGVGRIPNALVAGIRFNFSF